MFHYALVTRIDAVSILLFFQTVRIILVLILFCTIFNTNM